MGRLSAHALGEAGAKVMLSARQAKDLEHAAAELQAAGIDADGIAADCAEKSQIRHLADETMRRVDDVHILVDNAGATWGAAGARQTLWNALTLRFDDIIEDMTAPTGDSATSTRTVPARKNPLSPKKLLLSKWTAVAPADKEKHFVVTRIVVPDLPAIRIEWVEIEAVYSGRSSMLRWRDLTDGSRWRQGWV